MQDVARTFDSIAVSFLMGVDLFQELFIFAAESCALF
jgi:hypothetical protein